jgi:hypothetical protein
MFLSTARCLTFTIEFTFTDKKLKFDKDRPVCFFVCGKKAFA